MIFQIVARPLAFDDDGTAVHDISNAELAKGPDLVEAFPRLASVDPSDTRIVDARPAELIETHGGKTDDIPSLVSELSMLGASIRLAFLGGCMQIQLMSRGLALWSAQQCAVCTRRSRTRAFKLIAHCLIALLSPQGGACAQ